MRLRRNSAAAGSYRAAAIRRIDLARADRIASPLAGRRKSCGSVRTWSETAKPLGGNHELRTDQTGIYLGPGRHAGGFAILFLPMAPGAFDSAAPWRPTKEEPRAGQQRPMRPRNPIPQIVRRFPKNGATDVDPALTEISVTFDRDMYKGMSWTGGPPLFPPTDESRPARWTDARTCVLPVSLKKASYYQRRDQFDQLPEFPGQDRRSGSVLGDCLCHGRRERCGQAPRPVPKIVALSPENGAPTSIQRRSPCM